MTKAETKEISFSMLYVTHSPRNLTIKSKSQKRKKVESRKEIRRQQQRRNDEHKRQALAYEKIKENPKKSIVWT
jgi:hypothetical protein